MPPGRTTVFSKLPSAGAVKTRLCPPLSPNEAAELARAMLADTLEKLSASASHEVELAIHPPEALERARELARGITCVAQDGSDLGQRLARHFARALGTSARRTEVVVGADAPQVPLAAIEAAHEELAAGVELVLGPDAGGGYWLVGLARSVPELFTRVPMSTGDMCARTVALARELGLSVALVESHRDIDLPGDLTWLERELDDDERRAPRRFAVCPRTRAWLAARRARSTG